MRPAIAIHQPYFFPYVGYFQLLAAVDRFVFLDDVQFIRCGWIHRNRLFVAGNPHWFTLPIRRPRSTAPIDRVEIDSERLDRWQRKLLRTLKESYAGSPRLEKVLQLVRDTLRQPATVSQIARRSVLHCCRYLGVRTPTLTSSQDLRRSGKLRGEDGVLEICHLLGARSYCNAPGGRVLYDSRRFAEQGINLRFLAPQLQIYRPTERGPVPGLSILDTLLTMDRKSAATLARMGTLE